MTNIQAPRWWQFTSTSAKVLLDLQRFLLDPRQSYLPKHGYKSKTEGPACVLWVSITLLYTHITRNEQYTCTWMMAYHFYNCLQMCAWSLTYFRQLWEVNEKTRVYKSMIEGSACVLWVFITSHELLKWYCMNTVTYHLLVVANCRHMRAIWTAIWAYYKVFLPYWRAITNILKGTEWCCEY